MATRKVTITLDEHDLQRVRALVDSGATPSVSGFVQRVVGVALDDGVAWEAVLADALAATGGPLSADERAWADAVLGLATKKRKKTHAA